jgi:hypothetical protein
MAKKKAIGRKADNGGGGMKRNEGGGNEYEYPKWRKQMEGMEGLN